jgi:hypothetical protein
MSTAINTQAALCDWWILLLDIEVDKNLAVWQQLAL